MFLSFQTAFNLVSAAAVCAILESISGLEPSSDTIEPRWLSQASVRLLWPPCWCRWCCLSSTWSSRRWSQYLRLWMLCRDAQLILPILLPLLLSYRCHQQNGDLWLFCPPVLTVPSWSSKASVVILSGNMLKRVGESRRPSRTLTVIRNQSSMLPLKRTALVALS